MLLGNFPEKILQRLRSGIARVTRADALDRMMATLSGGERSRIGIARLLLEAPDLLLLDEPTNNLDTAGRAAIASLVRNWRGGVLVASHDRALLEIMPNARHLKHVQLINGLVLGSMYALVALGFVLFIITFAVLALARLMLRNAEQRL